MKKIYLLFIALLAFTLIVILVFYNIYAKSYKEEKINDYISKNIEILNENLETEKRYALSLSLLISQNPTLKKALMQNNPKIALVEMKHILKNIKNIDIQVHTKDLRAFARSWDTSNYFGAKLSSFRKGLVIVKKTKEPFVSIELGKRLNIKAISPIMDKEDNFIGSVEVIMDFENIKNRLKKFDLKMMILLDKKFINIAVDLKNHKKIDRYYIVSSKFNKKLYTNLIKHPNIFKRQKPYYVLGKHILVVIPMKSVGIQDVGFIVLCMNAKQSNPYSSYTKEDINQENGFYRFNKSRKREVIIR
jgi:hypothetical protein